jgi:hypothetical protein
MAGALNPLFNPGEIWESIKAQNRRQAIAQSRNERPGHQQSIDRMGDFVGGSYDALSDLMGTQSAGRKLYEGDYLGATSDLAYGLGLELPFAMAAGPASMAAKPFARRLMEFVNPIGNKSIGEEGLRELWKIIGPRVKKTASAIPAVTGALGALFQRGSSVGEDVNNFDKEGNYRPAFNLDEMDLMQEFDDFYDPEAYELIDKEFNSRISELLKADDLSPGARIF